MYGSRLDTTITWASGSSSARIRRTVAGVHFTSAALAEFPFFSNSRRSLRSGSAGGSFSTTRRRLRRTEASTAAIEKTRLVITKAQRAEVEEKNPRLSPVMRVTRRFCTRRPIIVLERDRGLAATFRQRFRAARVPLFTSSRSEEPGPRGGRPET